MCDFIEVDTNCEDDEDDGDDDDEGDASLHFALTPLTLAAAAAAEFGSVIYQVGHQRLPCTIPHLPLPCFCQVFSSFIKSQVKFAPFKAEVLAF